ncbi:hypothetical protein K1I36_01025 [Corynebacterium silvaticum]|uniref:hypothetical protein n=1 Tax=Corynebacterium silvaticum TaxID=2320431 RepID=UPI0010718F8C|nr:hypothetical protein [Corynebacterium silvaticum]MBH5301157.1 hypothetical protein [Corynebacterium silvaticum]NOM65357.1 hypothetical protein [Corynebacterium silvaticum]NON70995.1 hypothetical protein [Corynebacterium silvaticum]UWH00435.1 hypothetical protein K1I39_01015 [Corynebacterium silvaticum]UWH02483.1 hypothetical protein K1I38_01020 [Corynebacterium silvaticum]
MSLQDGTFIESGGNTGSGFTIGGKAGPLDGRGFTQWRHFPGGGEVSSQARRESERDSSTGASHRGDAHFGTATELHDIAKRHVGLYDQGGFLPHGGLAMNLSGRPEPVLTADQWNKIGKLVDAMNTVVHQLHTGTGPAAFLSHAQIVIDAEKGLEQTRKNIAAETAELQRKEEAAAQARQGLSKAERDATYRIADREAALTKARKGDKKGRVNAEAVAKAERDLAKAREDAPDKAKAAADKISALDVEINELREKSATVAKRLEAAERTVVAARLKAASEMALGVGEALQAGLGHVQSYFSAMGDLAEMVG